MTRYAQERIAQPARYFDVPDEVLDDENLSPEDKEKVLKSMAVDAEQMLDATVEGMDNPDQVYKAEDLRHALAKLSEAKEKARSQPDPLQNRSDKYQRIVVVTTVNQDLNRVALEHALDLADMSGGSISLLNVVPPNIDGVGPATGVPMAGTAEVVSVDSTEILKDRERLLAGLREVSGADDSIDIEVRAGPIEEEIVGYAEEVKADVIVVGSPNRSWLEGLFNPGVDRSVTKIASCPVLVVPEPEQ